MKEIKMEKATKLLNSGKHIRVKVNDRDYEIIRSMSQLKAKKQLFEMGVLDSFKLYEESAVKLPSNALQLENVDDAIVFLGDGTSVFFFIDGDEKKVLTPADLVSIYRQELARIGKPTMYVYV